MAGALAAGCGPADLVSDVLTASVRCAGRSSSAGGALGVPTTGEGMFVPMHLLDVYRWCGCNVVYEIYVALQPAL